MILVFKFISLIKMNKERFKLIKVEKKLKIENIERCLNCKLFIECEERKEEVVVCNRFKETPAKDQLVVVRLSLYGKKLEAKNQSLCSYC